MRLGSQLLAVIALSGGSVVAADPEPAQAWPELGIETSIIFPERTILNFEADEDRGVWIEDRRHRWYYARLEGACRGLRFALGLGFDSRGSVRFDRHSRIVTEDDTCPVESLLTSEGPPPSADEGNVDPATSEGEAPSA